MRSPVATLALAFVLLPFSSQARSQQAASPDDLRQSLRGLRQIPEAQRGAHVGQLAHEIAALPAGAPKLGLANALANLATEGDAGRDNLQAVTDTLAQAVTEAQLPSQEGKTSPAFHELAVLQHYEGMQVKGPVLDDPRYQAAAAQLVTQDEEAGRQDFTLKDMSGKTWTKAELKGRIVMLNFWATWCPPCRQELPNLDAIAQKYASQGLVILAVTDEDAAKVNTMFHGATPHFHIALDEKNQVHKDFNVESLPRTLVFDREGKLSGEAMDARTQRQFLLMLRSAGLQL